MNKYITLMLLMMGNFVFSQVGIATDTPHASSDLELGATNRALYLNRVADPENDIADPQSGMMLYDTTEHCVKVFGGDPAAWSDCLGGTVEPPTNPPGTGSLSGRMCFDVVEQFVSDECGQLTPREPQKAVFSQTATNTQTYTFTPIGTVSNVRFMYYNTNGQVIQSITPDADYSGTLTSPQTATATVVFYNNLNTAATGLSRENALLGDIYVIYNDGTEDKQLMLTAKVQDCNCCGAYISATVWKEFLCHNLGADTSVDPHTPSVGINGAYIQWGRRGPNTTGNSTIDWQNSPNDGTLGFVAAPTASDSNAGVVSNWATYTLNATDWNSGTEDNPIKTAKDPCPTGYRVPTMKEWSGMNDSKNGWIQLGSWQTSSTPTNNYSAAVQTSTRSLTLPAAGTYGSNQFTNTSANATPGIFHRGRFVAHWTSATAYHALEDGTINNTTAASFTVNLSYSDFPYKTFKRAMPVRCIAE